jgi:hypothetical protein
MKTFFVKKIITFFSLDELINIEDALEWFNGLENFLYYHRLKVYEKYAQGMELDY